MKGEQKAPLLASIRGPVLFRTWGSKRRIWCTRGLWVGTQSWYRAWARTRRRSLPRQRLCRISLGIVQTTFQEGNTTHNLSFATTGNQIQAQSTISNFGVSGLTAGVQTRLPGGANGKAHITYQQDYANLHAKILGFKAAPDLELSANLGNKRIFTGGIDYTTDEFTGSLVFDPLIEKSFDLYFTRFLSPRCQVGTHINRLYEKRLISAKVAGSYVYNN